MIGRLVRVLGICRHDDWNLLTAIERRIETNAMRELGGAVCATCGKIRLTYRHDWNVGIPNVPRRTRREALLAERARQR